MLTIALIAINARFSHSSLAIRYLAESLRIALPTQIRVIAREFNINQPEDDILDAVMRLNADAIGFSAYIWNIEMIIRLTKFVKRTRPEAFVFLGGPEVSYDALSILEKICEVDGIITGEGENVIVEVARWLCQTRNNGNCLIKDNAANIPGFSVRMPSGKLISTPPSPLTADLDSLPHPYSDGYADLVNHNVYYETSRGCPFACSYCLSSLSNGVRFLSIDGVKREVADMAAAGLTRVRFVDRTFNCNRERALEIWQYLAGLDALAGSGSSSGASCPGSLAGPGSPSARRTTYHFEVCADLLRDEDLNMLSTVPKGLFQFEIGVQSTCGEVLTAVGRKTDISRISAVVAKLVSDDRVEVNLDLIAGLPGETIDSFAQALDYTVGLSPSLVHLGFLKLLKGSILRARAVELGIIYKPDAPYTVLKTPTMSPLDFALLRDVARMLDLYYNNRRHRTAFQYLCSIVGSPFTVLAGLAKTLHSEAIRGNPTVGELTEALARESAGSGGAGARHGILETSVIMSELMEWDRLCSAIPPGNKLSPQDLSAREFELVARARPELKRLARRELAKRVTVRTFPIEVVAHLPLSGLSRAQLPEPRTHTKLVFIYPERSVGARAVEVLRVDS